MPKRIVHHALQVIREGQLVVPKIGKAFDFTADEIAQFNKLSPESLSKIEAGEDDSAPNSGITFTQADLDKRLQEQRDAQEKEIRAQIQKEQEDAAAAALAENTAKGKGAAKGAAAGKGAAAESDDDI